MAPQSSESYTSRRTYLLNRSAWGLIAVDLIYLIFGGPGKSWWLIGGCVVLAALCWVLAGSLEKRKRRKRQEGRFFDENGNAMPNKL